MSLPEEIREGEEGHEHGIQLRVEVFKNICELRQNEKQEEQQHSPRRRQQESRVSQRVGQAPAQNLGALTLDADRLENMHQISGRLADADERDIDRRKDARMVRNRVSEALSGKNCRGHLPRRRPHSADIKIGGEQFQRLVDPGAGAQQQGEVAGEDGDVLRARPRKQREAFPALNRRFVVLGDQVDRDQTQILDAPPDFRRGRRCDRPANDLADLAQDPVAERRHHLTVVTRSASATEVAPLRHLPTASSIIVVMPPFIAAASSALDALFVPMRSRTSPVTSSTSNTPERPR